MTPYEIQIALHYHTRVYDCWKPQGDIEHSALLGETLKWFQENGLLVFHDNEAKGHNYSPTGKLHAFCSMLQEVPLPVERFTDPRDRRVLSFEPVPVPVTQVRRCHFCKIDLRDDWVDPDWAPGPICRSCETMHEPNQNLLCCCSIEGSGPCKHKAILPANNPIYCAEHYNFFGNPTLGHPVCSSCNLPWVCKQFAGVGAKVWLPTCQCAGGAQSQPDPKARKEDVICPDCGKVIIGKDGALYVDSQLCTCGSKFS